MLASDVKAVLNDSDIARFFSKVQKGEGCWIWKAAKDPNGYGRIGFRRIGTALAHRVSWIIVGEALKDSDCLLHRCDTPSCVNPSHLFIGTRRDNTIDAMRKGRSAPNRKLSIHDARIIRELPSFGLTEREIAKHFGVAKTTVSFVLKQITFKESTYGSVESAR